MNCLIEKRAKVWLGCKCWGGLGFDRCHRGAAHSTQNRTPAGPNKDALQQGPNPKPETLPTRPKPNTVSTNLNHTHIQSDTYNAGHKAAPSNPSPPHTHTRVPPSTQGHAPAEPQSAAESASASDSSLAIYLQPPQKPKTPNALHPPQYPKKSTLT